MKFSPEHKDPSLPSNKAEIELLKDAFREFYFEVEEKLVKKAREGCRGWNSEGDYLHWKEEIARRLRDDDMRDVAALAMFAWNCQDESNE